MAPKQKASSRSSVAREKKTKKQSSPKPKASTVNYPPRYPQSLREAEQVRDEYFIPVKVNSGNFVLGPIYYPHAPAEFSTFYPVNHDEPLLLSLPGLDRTGWTSKGTIRSWPTVFESWQVWVIRMKKFLAPSWRKMNLYEAIDLSTQSFQLNPNLIAAAACFWSVSSNAFIFPHGPMTPNVLDIVHLTGLSCLGEEVNAALDHKSYNPPFNVSEGPWSYRSFINKYCGIDDEEPSFNEKIAFYLYWLNKYIMCVSGIKITKEYIRLAVCLAQDTKLALAPFVLGTLYKGLWTFVQNKITSNCGGPFWILQAWLYAYFPAIQPLSDYAKRKDSEQCLSYAEYFLSREPREEDISFRRYFKSFYKPDIRDLPNWLPFNECLYSTSEGIKPILHMQVPGGVVNQFWATILIPRFISIGFSPLTTNFSNCSFELYCPNQCARQFGLCQGIPVPYTHPRIKDLVKSRPNVTDTSVIKELVTHFKESMPTFQFESFVACCTTTPEFNLWWHCTQAILFTRDLENCLFRLDSRDTKSATIAKKLPVPQAEHKDKGKKAATAEDLSNARKRTRSYKTADVIHDAPIMADAMKRYKPGIQQEEMISKQEAEGSEIIGTYKRKTRRKLQLLPISDEENSVDKGSPARFSGLVDSEPSNVKCNIQLPVEHGVQISQENKESDKAEISLQSKSTEMVITSVQNAALQSCITNVNIGDTSLSQPTVSAEVVEKLIEPNADVSMTDTLNAEATVAQEEILDENQEIQSNADFEHQYTSMSSRDKDAVQSVVSGGKNTVDMQDKGFLSRTLDTIPQKLQTAQETDGQLTTDFNRNIGCEPFLLTEITEAEEQAQGTEILSTVGQELTIEKALIAPRFSVNEVNPELVTTPTAELDLMFNKAKLYSESFSRSVTKFSESLTPPAFYELGEDTKDELKSFFAMLELLLAEIATDHTTAFTNSVSQLIAKQVFPLPEHIRLQEFWSTLSENLTAVATCQKQMKEKRDTIDQFANVSKNLDTMGSNIQHLKDKLREIDIEEAELLVRLDKLKAERRSLLAQKESINNELAKINYNEQGIEVMASVSRDDFLKNQEKYNLIDNKWSYFKRLFMEFKSKIR